jgi:ATP-binding cassette, subfamily B (MDR/TAP), member 1
MGDGLVLESGTHNDLIQGGGAYARLVQAQKLREGRENTAQVDSDDVSEDSGHTVKKEAPEEIPLGRKNTGHSLASEILEQKRQQMKPSRQNEEREAYSLFYLVRRMSTLVRDQWRNYLIGAVFACCTYYFLYVYSWLT